MGGIVCTSSVCVCVCVCGNGGSWGLVFCEAPKLMFLSITESFEERDV